MWLCLKWPSRQQCVRSFCCANQLAPPACIHARSFEKQTDVQAIRLQIKASRSKCIAIYILACNNYVTSEYGSFITPCPPFMCILVPEKPGLWKIHMLQITQLKCSKLLDSRKFLHLSYHKKNSQVSGNTNIGICVTRNQIISGMGGVF